VRPHRFCQILYSNMKKNKSKLIVILGPTASGKSALAVKIAKKFNGEVISADSRQVYKGMDVGTGKVTQKEMQGIPHHLLDVASPKKRFTVVQYRNLALKAINKIFQKGKLPILCGGTGFYIQAVIDGIVIPEVKPDWRLRSRLERLSANELFKRLKKLDPKRAKTIERKNQRRLIRALEIIIKTKRPVPVFKKQLLSYPVLLIGVKKEKLEEAINQRVEKMFKLRLEKEVKGLVKKYGWILPLETIGYQEWSEKDYFKRKIDKKRVKELIKLHHRQYAKRQLTWFKRDKRIKWIKKQPEAEKLVTEFLRSKNEGKDEGKLRRR